MAGLFVHKRGNKWEYRFEVASVDGKRKFVQKSGFATKKDAIERTKGEVKEEIAAVKKANPGEALKLMKDFLKTWPKDGEDYQAEIPELQKQADAAKAAAKAAATK